MTISYEELINKKPSKWWQFIGRVERLINSPRKFMHEIKYFIQRGKRGYSDRDLWSADMYLAEVIAGILESYVHNKLGVGYPYATINGDVDMQYLEMQKDYSKHAKLFKEYSINGYAHNKTWQEEFGGLTEKELNSILKWLAKIYPGLWD